MLAISSSPCQRATTAFLRATCNTIVEGVVGDHTLRLAQETEQCITQGNFLAPTRTDMLMRRYPSEALINGFLVCLVISSISILWVTYALRETAIELFGSVPILIYLMIFASLFGIRPAILIGGPALGIFWLLVFANEYKIALVGMPITWTDILVFCAQPFVSLEALKLRGVMPVVGLAVLCLLLLVYLGALVSAVRRCKFKKRRTVALSFCAGSAWVFTPIYLASIDDHLKTVRMVTWWPPALVEVSRYLGMPAFIAYSALLEKYQPGHLRHWPASSGVSESSVTQKESAVNFQFRNPEEPLPNIVVILAESTFDPNVAFSLRTQVTNSLTADRPDTHMRGPLRVNAIGGGTWMSEFEAITGLDTRLFGYSGFYTHVSISPYVRATFVSSLNDRGYLTSAFYGSDGSFFNASKAFVRYGFQRFLDKKDLGITAAGWGATDREIIDSVIRSRPFHDDKPSFLFINFLQNHSPHRCAKFKTENDLQNQFSGSASFQHNCQLNDYLDIFAQSAQAIDLMREYLIQVERMSGRPYVLLVFGDHQPHTFTGTNGHSLDFTPLRKIPDLRVTLYHLMSSMAKRSPLRNGELIPLALLPTLLSSYVVTNRDEMYLPANASLFDACGEDAFGDGPVRGFTLGMDQNNAKRIGAPAMHCPYLPQYLEQVQKASLVRW